MKKIIILFCFIASMQAAFPQTNNLDALIQKLGAEKNEAKRIDLVNVFLANTAEVDPVLDMQNNKKILQYAHDKEDKIIEALSLSNIGYDYRAFGNTAMSLEYLLKATALASKSGNEKLIANTQTNLAHIYKDLADYSKAIKLYLSVLASGNTLKDSLLQIWAFNSLGQVYLQKDKLDSALMYSQRAYELSVQTGNANILSGILRYLGTIHGRMGNSSLAKSYFETAVKEGYKTNSLRFVSESYTGLAKYYYEENNIDSATVYARKAIAVVQNTAFSNKSIIPAKLLLEIYKSKNSDSALKYSEIYRTANDSLFSLRTIQQTQLMTFESEIKQQQLAAERQS